MWRIGLGVAFVLGLFLASLPAEAQQQGVRVPRIGVACNNCISHPRPDDPVGAFLQELGRLGYESGKNVVVDIRGTTGDRFPEIIADLVRTPVDILVVSPTVAALAAKAANLSIPVVFTVVAEPVELGLVASLARPGGNLTGVVNITADLAAKRLEILKEIVPRASRIAVLLDPAYPLTAGLWKSSLEASYRLNVKLDPVEVRSAPGLQRALNAMSTKRPDAGLILPSILTLDHRTEIAEFCLRSRLPTMFSFPDRDVQVGGLVAYGANYRDQWRQAAVYVDKILRGARPADLPVQQPTRFELAINLQTAKALGLTIPQSLGASRRDHPVMNRRTFLCGLTLGTLVAPLMVEAQQTGKVYRVGILSGGSPEKSAPQVEAFLKGLQDLGWVDGQNIVIEWRSAEGRTDRLGALAAELVQSKVDVIVTAASTPATVAAKRATATIPVVMVAVGAPVENGLVASQVALLWNPDNPANAALYRELREKAQRTHLKLLSVEVRHAKEFDSGFALLARQRPAALLLTGDPMHLVHMGRVIDFTAKNQLPAIYNTRESSEKGGLMSYGANQPELYRRAAIYVDRILKGAKPADLPVEQPTKFELLINLKTAKAMRLVIPQTLILQADHVIE